MGEAEFRRWMAYCQFDPFGEERADYRAARICQYVVAPYLKKGKKSKLKDYMAMFEFGPPRQMDVEEMQAKLLSFGAGFAKKK